MIGLAAGLLVAVLGSAQDWQGVEFTQVHFDAVTRVVGEKMLDAPQPGSLRLQTAWRRAAEMALWSLDPTAELLPEEYVDHLLDERNPSWKPKSPPQPLACQGKAVTGLRIAREEVAQVEPKALELAWQRWTAKNTFGHSEFLCAMAWVETAVPNGEQRRPTLWMAWVNAASGWLKALDHNADVIAAKFWEAESEAEHVAEMADPGLILQKCPAAAKGTAWMCCVADVRIDSAAWKADVRVNDRVAYLEGDPAGTSGSGCGNPKLLHGEDGSQVAVQVWGRRNGKVRSLALARDRAITHDAEAVPLGRGVVHLRLRDFVRGTAERVRQVARLAQAAAGDKKGKDLKGLVLDLRGNRGGVLDESVAVADWLLQSGAIVQTRWRDRTDERRAMLGPGELRAPVVVLMDRRCGSACEVLAGALQDHGRAPLLGTRSYGKGSMQKVQKPNQMWGFYLKYTIGKYLTPSGRDIDGKGMPPDVVLPADATTVFSEPAAARWQPAQTCVKAKGTAPKRLAAELSPRQKPDPWLEMAVDWLACLPLVQAGK